MTPVQKRNLRRVKRRFWLLAHRFSNLRAALSAREQYGGPFPGPNAVIKGPLPMGLLPSGPPAAEGSAEISSDGSAESMDSWAKTHPWYEEEKGDGIFVGKELWDRHKAGLPADPTFSSRYKGVRPESSNSSSQETRAEPKGLQPSGPSAVVQVGLPPPAGPPAADPESASPHPSARETLLLLRRGGRADMRQLVKATPARPQSGALSATR